MSDISDTGFGYSQEVLASYNFVEDMVPKADGEIGMAPVWHGWALREAFLAGVKFKEKGVGSE